MDKLFEDLPEDVEESGSTPIEEQEERQGRVRRQAEELLALRGTRRPFSEDVSSFFGVRAWARNELLTPMPLRSVFVVEGVGARNELLTPMPLRSVFVHTLQLARNELLTPMPLRSVFVRSRPHRLGSRCIHLLRNWDRAGSNERHPGKESSGRESS